MNNRQAELEAAANAVDVASLQAAKSAVALSCEEYLRWAEMFSRRLQSVTPKELHKFSRAFCLTLLGHLPTRPGTCPFCIQYGHDRSCRGCGYAATHGRCDAENSSFSIFIEAFQELGWAIYQETGELGCSAEDAQRQLDSSIRASIRAAQRLQEALSSAGAMQLMQLKAAYIAAIVGLIPEPLLGAEVAERCQQVKRALQDYW
jgi:hypothetical protein